MVDEVDTIAHHHDDEDDDNVVMMMVAVKAENTEGGGAFALPASWSERKLLVEEVARKSALQRRDSVLAKMHTRRASNLLRQVAMRDLRLQPLTRLIREYKERLRKAIVAAASDADRQPALADLQRLKQMMREAEGPCQRNDTRLERMAAMYDSDIDVMEGALSGGRILAAPAAAAAAPTTTTNAAVPTITADPSAPLLSSSSGNHQQLRGLSDTESAPPAATTTTTATTTTKRRRTVAAKRRAPPSAILPMVASASASASANPSQEDDNEENE